MRIKQGIVLLILILMQIGCSNSYVDQIDRSGGYQFRPGYPEVRLVTAGVVDELTDSTFVTLTAEIVYASLVFKKPEDLFQADIIVEVQIIDKINHQNIIDLKSYPITIKEKDRSLIVSQDEYLFKERYHVLPSEYAINLTVTDLSTDKQSTRTSDIYIPDPYDQVSHITNIQVFAKDETYALSFSPVTTYDISNQVDSVRFLFQVTNNKPESPITIDTRLLKFRSDTTIARPMTWPNYNTSHIAYRGINYDKYEVVSSSRRIINQPGSVSIEFLFPNLPRGNYRFEVKSDSDGDSQLFKARDFSVKSLNYPSLKTPQELAAPLYYLMDDKEYEKLISIEDPQELKKAIDRFWLKNIKNSKIAQNVISLYYERVEEANKQFANYKEGWKTDMGMVYILFGPPWYINESLSQISWAYSYNFDDFETNFYFQAPRIRTKDFPFYNYLLLRTTQYHQLLYRQTEIWRNGLILKDNL